MSRYLLAFAALAAPMSVGEAVKTHPADGTVNWIVLRYRGPADEQGPPVLLYADDQALRGGLAFLKRDRSDRAARVEQADLDDVAAEIARAHSRLDAGAADSPARFQFVMGGAGREPETLGFSRDAARPLVRSLLKRSLPDPTREALGDFADEHGLDAGG